MTLRRLPLFTWMVLVNSFLILLALPVLNASLVMLLIDRMLQRAFLRAGAGRIGAVVAALLLVFGHPEVYIMVLPAFGIISEVIPVFCASRSTATSSSPLRRWRSHF